MVLDKKVLISSGRTVAFHIQHCGIDINAYCIWDKGMVDDDAKEAFILLRQDEEYKDFVQKGGLLW